jgi:hypothetical protein
VEYLAEKDITQKILEDYNDVFADIVNVLLFDGKEIIKEDELTDCNTSSYYKIANKVKTQDRDVSKIWRRNQISISSFGFENQTVIEKNMPIRIIGYDGASYREQITNENIKKPNYPVVTMVLYFGMKRWNKNLSLKDCFDIPKELEPYVSDYKINVFEIAYLPDERVKMFKSDFRLIADYFVQLRKTGKYIPMPSEIRHKWETMNLLGVLNDDDRFEESYYLSGKKEGFNMCKVIDDYIEIGKERGVLNSIKELMSNLNWSLDEAMNAVGVPENKKKRYMELLGV